MQASGTLRNVCQNCVKFCHHYGEGKRWDASVESETSALCRQGELCEMRTRRVRSGKCLMFMEMNSFITMPSRMDCHYYGEGKRWDVSVESETSALCRQGELCEMCARRVGSGKCLMFMEMNSFITMPSCMDCLGKGTLRSAC